MIQITDNLPARAGIRDVTIEGQNLKEAYLVIGQSEAGVVYISSCSVNEDAAVENLLLKVSHLSSTIAFNIADDMGPIRMRLRKEKLAAITEKLLGDAPKIPEPATGN